MGKAVDKALGMRRNIEGLTTFAPSAAGYPRRGGHMNNANTINALALIRLELEAKEKSLTLVDGIIDVARKFDGKAPSKRFDTALKKVYEKLAFETSYNSFKIYMFIAKRSTLSHQGDVTIYLKDSSLSIIHACLDSGYGDGVCQNGTINGLLLVQLLEKYRRETEIEVSKIRHELDNIGDILARYNAAKAAVERIVDGTTYITRSYFKIS